MRIPLATDVDERDLQSDVCLDQLGDLPKRLANAHHSDRSCTPAGRLVFRGLDLFSSSIAPNSLAAAPVNSALDSRLYIDWYIDRRPAIELVEPADVHGSGRTAQRLRQRLADRGRAQRRCVGIAAPCRYRLSQPVDTVLSPGAADSMMSCASKCERLPVSGVPRLDDRRAAFLVRGASGRSAGFRPKNPSRSNARVRPLPGGGIAMVGPVLVVGLFAERHHHVQAVSAAALKYHHQCLAASAGWPQRQRSGTETRAPSTARRRPDHFP